MAFNEFAESETTVYEPMKRLKTGTTLEHDSSSGWRIISVD